MSSGAKHHVQVAAGLIWENGKILIARRPRGAHLGGYWEFPGGKQRRGETLEQCLEREIAEELGIKIRVENEVITVDHDYGSKMISLHVFNCRRVTGVPRPIDVQEILWAEPSNLSKRTFPPPDGAVIEFLLTGRRPEQGA